MSFSLSVFPLLLPANVDTIDILFRKRLLFDGPYLTGKKEKGEIFRIRMENFDKNKFCLGNNYQFPFNVSMLFVIQ